VFQYTFSPHRRNHIYRRHHRYYRRRHYHRDEHFNISCGKSRTQATQQYKYEAFPLPPIFPPCNPSFTS